MPRTKPYNSRFLVIAWLVNCLVMGCSSTGLQEKKPDNRETKNIPEKITLPTKKESLPVKFKPIRNAIDADDRQLAQHLLSNQKISSFSLIERVHHDLLSAELAWMDGDTKLMDDHLSYLPKSIDLPALEKSVYRLLEKRYSDRPQVLVPLIFNTLKMNKEASQRDVLRKKLWLTILTLHPNLLSGILLTTESEELKAWLRLAKLVKSTHPLDLPKKINGTASLPKKFTTLNPLPGGLEAISIIKSEKHTRLALILPLSGRLAPAARAIRDGFLAAFFFAKHRNSHTSIHIIDSTKTNNITDAYLEAVELQADYVIGPLEKSNVNEIAKLPDLPIPVLALNQAQENVRKRKTKLIQFSLSPIDEVIQITNLAFNKRYRNALVVAPNDSWGEKLSTALSNRWKELGGEIRHRAKFGDASSYSDDLKRALQLNQSENRVNRIGRIVGNSMQFKLRRRQDLDVIFLLTSSPEQARALKPLLTFHFAEELPVYSTSKINYGTKHESDRDLEDITFVEMPWLLNSPHLLEMQRLEATNASSSRLQALGADAFLILYFLSAFKDDSEMIMLGHTGLITLNDNGRILRESIQAQFVNGTLITKPN